MLSTLWVHRRRQVAVEGAERVGVLGGGGLSDLSPEGFGLCVRACMCGQCRDGQLSMDALRSNPGEEGIETSSKPVMKGRTCCS